MYACVDCGLLTVSSPSPEIHRDQPLSFEISKKRVSLTTGSSKRYRRLGYES